MKAGEASTTARRVAAHRLGFERVASDYGNPADDERLSRDVAGDLAGRVTSTMSRYLAARTSFFDTFVTDGLAGGIAQVVVAAAGYDGRSLRYAKPGVRWFELDHPDTQADKLGRIARLGIDTSHVAFVASDFATDDVAADLLAAGYDPAVATLFLVEGVAVYLDRPILSSLLGRLGSLASAGSRLAISLSISVTTDERRSRFQAAVAAMGEPARTVLEPAAAANLLATTGWSPSGDGLSRGLGLVIAEPVKPS